MKIETIKDEENILRIIVSSNEETLFSLLKVYFEQEKEVDLVGVYKEHYLIDKTEFYLKTHKQSAKKVFKSVLSKAKKDLLSFKLK